MRILMASVALAAVAACSPQIPESGVGVGFDNAVNDPQARARREAALNGTPLPAAQAVSEETLSALDATAPTPPVTGQPATTTTAIASTVPLKDGNVVQASPNNPAPQLVDNPGISDENNFAAVEGRRDIESDAARLEANRQQYTVIEPTALPKRTSAGGPNIVSYAIQSNNPVGVKLYTRIGLKTKARHERNCAKYPSADQAQAAFLAKGGPQRDRMGLDPDGDGFACTWDPTPFRSSVGG
jgi:hypothetical protein